MRKSALAVAATAGLVVGMFGMGGVSAGKRGPGVGDKDGCVDSPPASTIPGKGSQGKPECIPTGTVTVTTISAAPTRAKG